MKIRTHRIGIKIGAALALLALVPLTLWQVPGLRHWLRGWIFLGLLVVGQSISALCIWKKNPDLLIRRASIGKGTKGWDIVLLSLFALSYLGILVVAALDRLYGWSEMGVWLWPIGFLLYIFFVALFTWAMAENPFFEKTVRIQHDRGHRVIDSGPYRVVRHPGYTAAILGLIFATPMLLASWWSFLPALLAAVLLIIRTALEDRTLQRELAGYEEYAARVRYRLLRGIW